jgi:hypothetical protein
MSEIKSLNTQMKRKVATGNVLCILGSPILTREPEHRYFRVVLRHDCIAVSENLEPSGVFRG